MRQVERLEGRIELKGVCIVAAVVKGEMVWEGSEEMARRISAGRDGDGERALTVNARADYTAYFEDSIWWAPKSERIT